MLHDFSFRPTGEIFASENDSASVVDVTAGHQVVRIEVGPSPVQVRFVPNGARRFVSLRGADAVAEIDLGSRRVVRRIPVGPLQVQVFATPDVRLVHVANEGTRAKPGTTASVIDVAAGPVAASVQAGHGAHGATVRADGSRAYVTNVFDDTVAEINVATQKVSRRFRVGRGPMG